MTHRLDLERVTALCGEGDARRPRLFASELELNDSLHARLSSCRRWPR
jgi:hypothetical protein